MRMQTAYAGAAAGGTTRKIWRREDRERLRLPLYSLGEEIFSAVSHGAAALFGVAALVLLLVFCEKTPLKVVSVCVFGGTMILLYTVSTLYHALGVNRAKRVFRVLDHCTIFLLIAGTYTPITLCCLQGAVGFMLFGVVWGAAILGIALNAVNMERFKKLSMVCYLAMGWVVISHSEPLWRACPRSDCGAFWQAASRTRPARLCTASARRSRICIRSGTFSCWRAASCTL